MPWIRQQVDAETIGTLRALRGVYPKEYSVPPEQRQVPDAVRAESIITAHTLIPKVMDHVFRALAAMYDPALPLSRKQHEMIATVVSSVNDCFY